MFPLNPALPDEVVIVDVPQLKVSAALEYSIVPKSIGVEEQETVLAPKEIVLEFAPEETIVDAVKAYPAVSNEPFAITNEPIVRALPSVHPQLTPFTVIAEDSVFPFVVKVRPVELLDSVMAPVYVRVIPVAASDTLPWM